MQRSNSLNSILIRLKGRTALLLALAGLTGCQLPAEGENLEGVRLYQQGHYQQALQRFQQAVVANPDSPDAYYNMAATLHRKGSMRNNEEKLAMAEKLYNQCLNLAPDHVDCHRGLAVLLAETDRSDRAFALLKNWAVRSPQVPEARIELARLFEEFGDLETAELHLQQALQIDQQNPRAWAALGRMREAVGDHAQALANYERSFQLNSMQPAVAERMAALHVSLNSRLDPTPQGGPRTVTR